MSSAYYRITVVLCVLFYTSTNKQTDSVPQSFARSRSAGRSTNERSFRDAHIQPRSLVRHRNSHIRRQSPELEAPPPLHDADIVFDVGGRLNISGDGAQSVPMSQADTGFRPVVSPQDFHEQCQSDCRLHVTNLREAQARFEDLTDDIHPVNIVHFKVKIILCYSRCHCFVLLLKNFFMLLLIFCCNRPS